MTRSVLLLAGMKCSHGKECMARSVLFLARSVLYRGKKSFISGNVLQLIIAKRCWCGNRKHGYSIPEVSYP